MRERKRTHAVAFCGIMSAMCVVLMYFGSVIDVLDYSVAALCGILTTLVIVEFGDRAGISVWITSSVLALILLPSKFSSLLFVAFCGWYSLVKKVLERLSRVLCILLKFLIFNAVLTVIYIITVKVITVETLTPILTVAVFLLSNIVFVIYDVLLTKIIFLYVNLWRKRLKFLK